MANSYPQHIVALRQLVPPEDVLQDANRRDVAYILSREEQKSSNISS